MDLGIVYSRCIPGEFDTLQDVVHDVELVFANAMRYNPKGHPIHNSAIEVRELFLSRAGPETGSRMLVRWFSSGHTTRR